MAHVYMTRRRACGSVQEVEAGEQRDHNVCLFSAPFPFEPSRAAARQLMDVGHIQDRVQTELSESSLQRVVSLRPCAHVNAKVPCFIGPRDAALGFHHAGARDPLQGKHLSGSEVSSRTDPSESWS